MTILFPVALFRTDAVGPVEAWCGGIMVMDHNLRQKRQTMEQDFHLIEIINHDLEHECHRMPRLINLSPQWRH